MDGCLNWFRTSLALFQTEMLCGEKFYCFGAVPDSTTPSLQMENLLVHLPVSQTDCTAQKLSHTLLKSAQKSSSSQSDHRILQNPAHVLVAPSHVRRHLIGCRSQRKTTFAPPGRWLTISWKSTHYCHFVLFCFLLCTIEELYYTNTKVVYSIGLNVSTWCQFSHKLLSAPWKKTAPLG